MYNIPMNPLTRLLTRLGLNRTSKTQKFTLEATLQDAVDLLARKQQRSPNEVLSNLVASELANQSAKEKKWEQWQCLTPREQQVTALTCLGYTNPQMAARLGIAVETVRTHTQNTQNKFNVNNKIELRQLFTEWDFSDWG